jgi:hypothetical protein
VGGAGTLTVLFPQSSLADDPVDFTLTTATDSAGPTNPPAKWIFQGCITEGTALRVKTCRANELDPINHSVTLPFIRVEVSVPTTGWYLLDFTGAGNPRATLYTLTSGAFPSLEYWDYASKPSPTLHLATVEQLAAGNHTFYLVIQTGSFTANSFRFATY